jgi:hypothetical protein
MKNIMVFILLLVFAACKQANRGVENGVTEIRIIPEKSNPTDILHILKDITLTPLETRGNSLIGNVRRIKTDKDCFYITDYSDNPVKVFSTSGKFVSEIGHKGNGPGEYIQMSDILISHDTVCIGAWSGNRKWIRYSKDNRFLYETDMLFPVDDICRTGNDRYMVYVSNGTVSDECDHYLYCLDKDFGLLSRLDPKRYPSDIPLAFEQKHFFQNGKQTLYIREYCDTIYTLSDNLEIHPKYHLNFGKHWYTKSFLEKYHDEHFMRINNAIDDNSYGRWVNFWENDSHLLVNYQIHNNGKYDIYLAVYFRDTGHTLNFKGLSDDIYVNLMIHPYCIHGNQFIGLIQADELLELASKIKKNDSISEKVKKCATQISETDNPVMVRFSFRSDKNI